MGGSGTFAAFSAYPPSWVYWIDGIIVKKTITFDGSLSVTYDITGDADLWIRPLITDRPVHGVMRDPAPGCTNEPDGFRWGEIFFHGDCPTRPALSPTGISGTGGSTTGVRTGGGSLIHGCFPGTGTGFCRPVPLRRRRHSIHRNPPRARSPQAIPGWLDRAADAFCQGDEIVSPATTGSANHGGVIRPISVTGLLIERGMKRRGPRRAQAAFRSEQGWRDPQQVS